ncbi:MAG: PDZ domain-containing protein [Alphaproteobacteria bacterium]|nr:PDZ domain-containing protein [Alphaproteobacteria bacterium]
MLPLLLLAGPALAGDPCPIDLVFHEATPSWRDREADLAALRSRSWWLGVSYGSGSPVRVTAVAPDGPAGRAGLTRGDLLESVDGQPIADSTDVGRLLDAAARTVALGIRREGAEQTLTIERGAADPVFLGAVQALHGQDCRNARIDGLTDAQRAAVERGVFTPDRAFRCDDAHRALAPSPDGGDAEDGGFASGDVVVVRGGRRILWTMPGWATRCVDVAALDGDALTDEHLRELVEALAAPYVQDRHDNP